MAPGVAMSRSTLDLLIGMGLGTAALAAGLALVLLTESIMLSAVGLILAAVGAGVLIGCVRAKP